MSASTLSRRSWLAAVSAGTAPLLQSPAWGIHKKKARNIVLLIADDHGMDMPCFGNPHIQTPNLDRLAEKGVRFTNAFCTTSSCSPSRSVIFTGLQNHCNGQYGLAHDYHHFQCADFVQSLPRLLKNQGYRTGSVGKWHVNPVDLFPFDFKPASDSRNVTTMAARAGQFFSESGDQPFFLQVGFSDPHRAEKGFANEENKSKIEPVIYSPEDVQVPPFLPDNQDVREELADYYQAVSRMDTGIGLILDALRESGKENDTLVIYISDNGIPWPGAKTCLYDPGIQLPMIIYSPDQSRRGWVNHSMVSFTDITPTILDWAGAPGPQKYELHGHSILPILEETQAAGWDEIFFSHTFHEVTMYYPSRGIRTRRYKYIHNLAHQLPFPFASDLWGSKTWQGILQRKDNRYGPRTVAAYMHRAEEELYDLQHDPLELHNLAEDETYAMTLANLRERTEAFRKHTKDPWMILNNYTMAG